MSKFAVSIDANSSVPPFRQLHNSIVAAVKSGLLAPGTKLPTVRGFATELGLAVNTVAAAYRSLEESGVTEGRGRAGTFVRLGVSGDPVDEESRRVIATATLALRDLGVDRDSALRLLTEAYDSSAS